MTASPGRRGVQILVVVLASASLCVWWVNCSSADRFYPMVMSVRPVAVQAGQPCECEFESRYSMHGASKVFVTGAGVVGEVDPPPAVKGGATPQTIRLKVRFKTTADALPGMRD